MYNEKQTVEMQELQQILRSGTNEMKWGQKLIT